MPLPGIFRGKHLKKTSRNLCTAIAPKSPPQKNTFWKMMFWILNQNLSTHVTKHRFCDEIHHGKCIKKQLPVKTTRQQVACMAGWAKVFTSVTLWTKWTLVGPGDSTDQTRHQTQVRDVFCDGYWMLLVFFKGQFKFRMVFVKFFVGGRRTTSIPQEKPLKLSRKIEPLAGRTRFSSSIWSRGSGNPVDAACW